MPPTGPSAGSIRTALEKILSSSDFADSGVLARLLRYLVEETLAGRGDRVNETVIGAGVFGQDDIVRAETSRLRDRLRKYFEGDGRDDAIRIDLPKGGYIPIFSEQERAAIPERTVPGKWIVLGILVFSGTVVSIAGTWLFSRPRARQVPPPSIVVLPFLDLSTEKNQQYFCDGVTDELIDQLARIPGFQVMGRTTVFALAANPPDTHEIGQRFNIRSVLQGSIQRSGNHLRVTADLVNTSDGFHLWSHTYEREITDISLLEDEIFRAIVDTLQLKAAAPATPVRPVDPEAYDSYLQGRFRYFKGQEDEVRRSIDLYRQAVARVPNYALAYAGLADSHTWLGLFGSHPNDALAEARVAAEKALSLDEGLDSAHLVLAQAKAIHDYDWPGAQVEFQRAMELHPAGSNAPVSHSILYLAPLGRTKEALAEIKRALASDPLNQEANAYLGMLYYLDRQYPAAVDQLRKTIDQKLSFSEAHELLFQVYVSSGKLTEARTELERLRTPGSPPPDLLADLNAIDGRTAEARQIVAALERKPGSYVSKMRLAFVYAALGEKSRAIDELELAYREHDPMIVYLKTLPELDPLRSEPRFQALLAKMQLNP